MTKTIPTHNGFTLIELLITLVVAAILLSIATPSFRDTVQDNRLVTQVNGLQSSLALAKSEAITRNNNITVCSSNDRVSCSGNWEDGWIVFVDSNANTTLDGEEIVQVQTAVDGTTIRFNRARIIYDGRGFALNNSDGTISLCDSRGVSSARALIISPSGRTRLAIDSNTDGIVDAGTTSSPSTTTNITCP